MLADTYLEERICSGCGNPLWLTTDDKTWWRGDQYVCRSCQATQTERADAEALAGDDPKASAGVKYYAYERAPDHDHDEEAL